MRNASSMTVMALCTCLIVFVPSCSYLRHVTAPAIQEHKVKVIDDTTKQAQASMAQGEYKKALELYSNAYDKYHYPELSSSYARTGDRLRNAADTAYQKKDFAEAGSIYNTLFENGITTRDFAQSLSFDDAYLDGQIKACSKALLEAGLTTYREGKLEDAVAVWKKALAFDRDNKDIKNMIETATTQVQNLKNIKEKTPVIP
jgi:tetratricopeptide (TPR) repeat protein